MNWNILLSWPWFVKFECGTRISSFCSLLMTSFSCSQSDKYSLLVQKPRLDQESFCAAFWASRPVCVELSYCQLVAWVNLRFVERHSLYLYPIICLGNIYDFEVTLRKTRSLRYVILQHRGGPMVYRFRRIKGSSKCRIEQVRSWEGTQLTAVWNSKWCNYMLGIRHLSLWHPWPCRAEHMDKPWELAVMLCTKSLQVDVTSPVV